MTDDLIEGVAESLYKRCWWDGIPGNLMQIMAGYFALANEIGESAKPLRNACLTGNQDKAEQRHEAGDAVVAAISFALWVCGSPAGVVEVVQEVCAKGELRGAYHKGLPLREGSWRDAHGA